MEKVILWKDKQTLFIEEIGKEEDSFMVLLKMRKLSLVVVWNLKRKDVMVLFSSRKNKLLIKANFKKDIMMVNLGNTTPLKHFIKEGFTREGKMVLDI